MILLKLLLYMLLFIVFVFLILIFSPIKGQAWLTETQLKVRGKYIFNALTLDFEQGHLSVYFLGFHLSKKSKDKSKEDEVSRKNKKIKKKKEKKKRKKEIPSIEVMFLSLKLIKKLIKKILPRELNLSLELGLDDPYDTGMVCLVNQILLTPLNKVKAYDLRFHPLYGELDLKLKAYGKLNFSIASLFFPILWWGLKKPIRHYFGWTFKRKN